MRVIEILREFVDSENAGPTNPVEGLTYLLTHHRLSPVVLKQISHTVTNIEKTDAQQPQAIPSLQAQQSQQQLQQPQGQQNTEPTEPIDQDSDEIDPIDDGDEDLNEVIMDQQSLVASILSLNPNSPQLQGLYYQTADDVFKKMVSDIVKAKIKFKTRETYELIKSKVRSLSTKVPVDIMDEFLKLCLEQGVIDAPSMISGNNTGGQIPLVDQKFRKVADAFLDLNLERLGKGEIGLAFMGIDALKESSDVSISGLAIEVKAAKGSDFFMKGNPDEGGFGHQVEAVKIFVKALNSVGADFKETNRSKQGGIAAVGRTNIKYLNSFFTLMGRMKTINTLIEVLKILCKKDPKIVNAYKSEIKGSVSRDGSIIYKNLELVAAKINFDYYKQMSKHEGVLVLNLPKFEYAYVNDATGWADLINLGILLQKYPLDFRSNGLGGIAYDMA